ncbi:MAG TPA: isoprenylcysteine carboxylmethyltransferase family protein [Caldimonas sp.]
MNSLEVKVPPPAVASGIAVVMWVTSKLAPLLQVPSAPRLGAAAALLLVGIGFSAAGVLAFRRARTTVNPMKPETTSSLVSSGIYRVTRNPMYVGLLFVLIAWAVFLSSAWALLWPAAFVLYISRFQIAPEERALDKLFGSEYADYRARVRRWL